MSGRRVFFSFHYKEDVWRASNVRNAGQFDPVAAAGWKDASLWEETKRKGNQAIQRLIDKGLKGTSVTVVLIGAHTAQREWVTYEIEQSIKQKNGLLGVRIHDIKDQNGKCSTKGHVPDALTNGGFPVYSWDKGHRLGNEIELAAIKAGRPCLTHGTEGCMCCRLYNWFNI